jgi:hypothetical protein
MATLLFLAWGGPAAGVLAADYAGNSGGSQVARYHVGDLDENASSPAKASQGAAKADASLAAAGYFYGAADQEVEAPPPANYSNATAGGPACGCNSCSQATGCCNQCNCCDWWCDSLRFEYLMWWTRGRNAPPLVSTGPLDDPATDILYPDGDIGTDIRSGARITFNHLLADGATWADLRFWGIEDSSETFTAADPGLGATVIGRPFFNTLLGTDDFQAVASAGIAENGSIRVVSKNDLIGGDAWLRQTWRDNGCTRLDVLAGYMFTRLDDSIVINAVTTGANPALPSFGVIFDVTDSFRTQNEFHGAQIGFLATSRRNNNLSVELLGKVALGDMRQAVIINGSQTQTNAGVSTTFSGGLLALSTNSGEGVRHRFAVVPEINLNLVYEVNPCWRVMAGYSFIYWSSVVLAGNQIDLTVNPSQIPPAVFVGPARPAFDFARTDFWAQGLSLGVEYRW